MSVTDNELLLQEYNTAGKQVNPDKKVENRMYVPERFYNAIVEKLFRFKHDALPIIDEKIRERIAEIRELGRTRGYSLSQTDAKILAYAEWKTKQGEPTIVITSDKGVKEVARILASTMLLRLRHEAIQHGTR